MSLDKKQKKQIEAAKTKLVRLRQLLNAARDQPDDPQDVPRLKGEIAAVEEQIRKINES